MARAERKLQPDRSALDKFGFELREWRKARGLSQAQLGKIVHVSADLIYRIELASRKPSHDFAQHCDRVLHAQGALLRQWGEVAREAEQRKHPAAPVNDMFDDNDVGMRELRETQVAGVAQVMQLQLAEASCGSLVLGDRVVFPCRADDGRIVLVSLSRRDFLRSGVGATAVGTAAAAGILGGDLQAEAAPLGYVEDHPAEHFNRTRQVLRDADNLLGSARVKPVLYEQLLAVAQAGKRLRGADRMRLLSVQAQFGDLYAWLQQDSGNYHDAQYWLDRAHDWALMAEDQEGAAFILARKGQVAGEMGNAGYAIAIAQLAERHPNPNRSKNASVASIYAAYGHALQGEEGSCLRSYDRAIALLSHLQSEPPANYGNFLDRAYIEVHRAHSMAALGHHAAAADIFDAALGSLPTGYHRDRGIYLTYKALAHMGANDPDQAVAAAMHALSIGADTKSDRIITGVHNFDQALPASWAAIAEVKEFRSVLSGVPRSGVDAHGYRAGSAMPTE